MVSLRTLRVIGLLLLLWAPASWAYLPKSWLILSRTADNHGKGIYRIEQDVIFTHGDQPLVVREDWLVETGQRMLLKVKGRKQLQNRIRMGIAYGPNRRTVVDEKGVKRQRKNSDDWFEDFFHFRFSDRIKPRLYALNIIPKSGLTRPPRPFSLKSVKHESENFVRLSRTSGAIAFALGTPSPVGSERGLPGMWIQQDAFRVLKIRMPSGALVQAGRYSRFKNALELPRERRVQWDEHEVEINLVKVTWLGRSKKVSRKISPSGLTAADRRILPQDEIIQDFYSRFR